MSYRNERYKLRKIWEQQFDTNNKIKSQKDFLAKNINTFLRVYHNYFLKSIASYYISISTMDFFEPDNLTTDDLYASIDKKYLYNCLHYHYEIDFKDFPQKFLPFITVNFTYFDQTAENDNEYQIIENPILDWKFLIEDETNVIRYNRSKHQTETVTTIVDCKLLVNVTMNISLVAIGELQGIHQFPGRLLIDFINPEQYI